MLLHAEGFEVNRHATWLARAYDPSSSITSNSFQAGRIHGFSWTPNSSNLRVRAIAAQNETVLGFGLRHNASSGTYTIARFFRNTVTQCRLQIRHTTSSTYVIDLVNGGGVTLATTSTLAINAWYYIEVKINFHASTGSCQFRIDTVNDASASNVDTTGTGGVTGTDQMEMTGTSQNLDDWYWLSTTGGTLTDFLGDRTLEGIYPDSDGAVLDFTPSSGTTHWNLLLDDPGYVLAHDSSYVSSNTSGHRDLVGMTNLSVLQSTIDALITCTTVRLDVLGSRTLRGLVRSGGTIYNGPNRTINTVTFESFYTIWEQDPDVADAWTIASINNVQTGFELVS